MHIRKIFIIILACCSLNAAAEIISLAHEVLLPDLKLPTYTTGVIRFKECQSCNPLAVNVTADTQYFLNKKSIPLSEFSKELALIVRKNKTTATVMHHLESDTVTAVHVDRK